jgi:hypothetical protein
MPWMQRKRRAVTCAAIYEAIYAMACAMPCPLA